MNFLPFFILSLCLSFLVCSFSSNLWFQVGCFLFLFIVVFLNFSDNIENLTQTIVIDVDKKQKHTQPQPQQQQQQQPQQQQQGKGHRHQERKASTQHKHRTTSAHKEEKHKDKKTKNYNKKEEKMSKKESPEQRAAIEPFLCSTKLEDDYHLDKVIGSGGFSVVRLAYHKETKTKVALKLIPKEKAYSGMNLLDEIQLARSLGTHENIIRTYEVYDYKEYYVIVLEYVQDGELLSILLRHFDQGGVYSEGEIAVVIHQFVSGLAHCHHRRVIHRDLKPDNVLVADEYKFGNVNALKENPIKLCDFGMAAVIPESGYLTSSCGTPEYMAPERLRGENYGPKSDIWSAGVLLYILIAGTFPFWGPDAKAVLQKAESPKFPLITSRMKEISKDCRDLLSQMLAKRPEDRPTAEQLLKNPWLTGKTAPTFEIRGAVKELRKFNAQRKLRIAINGVLAQNRMRVILQGVQAEHLFFDLTIKESFTLQDLRNLYSVLIKKSDSDNMIDYAGFCESFATLQIRNTAIAKDLFKTFKKDQEYVNVQDFCLSLGSKLTAGGGENDLLEFAFEIFDEDENGTINKEEFFKTLTGILSTLDEKPTKQWLNEEFESADIDKSGDLCKEEFFQTVKGNIKFQKYLSNVNNLLKFRSELFEEQITNIKTNTCGSMYMKRPHVFGFLSSLVERFVVYDPNTKVLKVYPTQANYNAGDEPGEEFSLIDGDFKITDREKVKRLSKQGKEKEKDLRHTKSERSQKPKFRFEVNSPQTRQWEFPTHEEENAWIWAFKESGLKIQI